MNDALGRAIKEGDYLIYPGRYSSHMWLTLAHVIQVAKGRVTVDRVELGRSEKTVKRTYTSMVNRAIIVPAEAVPERYRSVMEGPLVWDDHSLERVRKRDALPPSETKSLLANPEVREAHDSAGETEQRSDGSCHPLT